MGLFGLFATIITGGVYTAESIKNANYNRESKERAIQRGSKTYMDYKGNDYLVSTGERVYESNGQLKSLKTGRVIIDYNKERERSINGEAIAKAKSEGKKYARLLFTEFSNRYYYVELSTMKRYYLKDNHIGNEAHYYKVYYPYGREKSSISMYDPKEEAVEITQKEFKDLGGFVFSSGSHEMGRIW